MLFRSLSSYCKVTPATEEPGPTIQDPVSFPPTPDQELQPQFRSDDDETLEVTDNICANCLQEQNVPLLTDFLSRDGTSFVPVSEALSQVYGGAVSSDSWQVLTEIISTLKNESST